eukprot:c8643_g2_i1.p1 GENE.c8643_g2_i1~~c8643_g2_i1.p1  ORF type:complete len:123 (+),score=14.21 c8643_g2_i1:206-574(+)
MCDFHDFAHRRCELTLFSEYFLLLTENRKLCLSVCHKTRDEHKNTAPHISHISRTYEAQYHKTAASRDMCEYSRISQITSDKKTTKILGKYSNILHEKPLQNGKNLEFTRKRGIYQYQPSDR